MLAMLRALRKSTARLEASADRHDATMILVSKEVKRAAESHEVAMMFVGAAGLAVLLYFSWRLVEAMEEAIR